MKKLDKKLTSIIIGVVSGIATKSVVSMLTDNKALSTAAGVGVGTTAGVATFKKMEDMQDDTMMAMVVDAEEAVVVTKSTSDTVADETIDQDKEIPKDGEN